MTRIHEFIPKELLGKDNALSLKLNYADLTKVIDNREFTEKQIAAELIRTGRVSCSDHELVNALGKLTFNRININKHMQVGFQQFKTNVPLVMDRVIDLESKMIGIGICMVGELSLKMEMPHKKAFTLKSGEGLFVLSKTHKDKILIPAKKDVMIVHVITSVNFIEEFIQQLGDVLSDKIRDRILNDNTFNHFQASMLTSNLLHSLNEILWCPYKGKLRDIFLEAKSLELTAFLLDHLIGLDVRLKKNEKSGLDRDELKKVNKARDILIRNLHRPISIPELAKMVFTNECYLKKNFKKVFGKTIHSYYHDARMDKARLLLGSTKTDINGISSILGYQSPGYFSAAFKKQFGVSPGAFRKAGKAQNKPG